MWLLVLKWWKPIVVALAMAYFLIAAYGAGASRVQQDWDAERVTIAQALKENAEAQRDKEYADQQKMNKVQTDATQRLEALRTDADSANAAADRLREQVGKLIVCPTTRAGTSSQTASNPGNLLAVVLDKSIQRNRELAAFADAAITAAQACEKARN